MLPSRLLNDEEFLYCLPNTGDNSSRFRLFPLEDQAASRLPNHPACDKRDVPALARSPPSSEHLFNNQSFTVLQTSLASWRPNNSSQTYFTHSQPQVRCSLVSVWSHTVHVNGTKIPLLDKLSLTTIAFATNFHANTLIFGIVLIFQIASHRFSLGTTLVTSSLSSTLSC